MFDSCSDNCAWIAAIISCLSFGSFGVPIKSPEAQRVKVDPLVFQSYKTFMCFITSWLVLPMGQEYYFTPWGIVSGLFWVPAGIAAIYAIQHAGLAVSQGVWSSLIVLVSFVWGIFIFQEQVKSKVAASIAVLFMMIGLWGMSFYSSPETMATDEDIDTSFMHDLDMHIMTADAFISASDASETEETVASAGEEQSLQQSDCIFRLKPVTSGEPLCSDIDGCITTYGPKNSPEEIEENLTEVTNDMTDEGGISCHEPMSNHMLNQRGFSLLSEDSTVKQPRFSRRFLGLSAAVFNGVWGGSIMVPMQFAPPDAHGTGYVISFAIGASIITLALWVIRYMYLVCRFNGSFYNAYLALPSLHMKVMWAPGGLAGTLWSLGNLSSMVSVHLLGEGVGYSVTQASMLVSGLWGIFYFKEVTGTSRIIKWLISSLICLTGIIWLSYEHE